jgi:hypothetical protein
MFENPTISFCGLIVASPNTPLTMAVMYMASQIGYLTLHGMFAEEKHGFIGNPAETQLILLR